MPDASQSRRAFATIWDDYAFFEAHTDEAERNLAAWCQELPASLKQRDHLQLLDFGDGSGRVFDRFLQQAGFTPEQLELTLLEPDAQKRQEAVALLRDRTTKTINDVAHQSELDERTYNLITSHHVFYYVRDVEAELQGLWNRLEPGGLMLLTLAGRARSRTIQFWYEAYAHLGREVPCLNAEHVQAALERLGLPYTQKQVPVRIAFDDTPANRLHVPRFLMGEDYAALGDAFAAEWIGRFSRDGRVVIDQEDELFILQRT